MIFQNGKSFNTQTKNINMVLRALLSILFIFSYVKSQTRYLDEIFDEVTKTEDVIYGNAPDLPFVFLFEWNTIDIDLDMDIYEPAGDTITNRPVIIFIHSGAFFTGNNEADDVVALSVASAKRGYVAVSMNYRLGLNVLSSYSGERAVYRGVQDASAAIRYLREHHTDYGIDYEKIFIWGTSAGSFIGLHLTFTEDDERTESTFGGGEDPDLGCINCEGNDYEHDSKPNAVISCWGAIGDLNWIDQHNNTPTIMFHGTSDAVVPFNSGYPFTIDIFLPLVYGSNLIHNRLNELNIENELYAEEGLIHEYWGTYNGSWAGGPNDYFDLIKYDSYSFLFSLLYPYLVGDVNTDGLINNLDFANMLSFIINEDNPNVNLYYSDLNYDGLIDIFDLLFLLELI
ncbi:MAG: carboxylesterase family protein [Candidatus Marinimicrobia bacterium]|nr:carboxylesterase family protein [Candidatus Neomarinimicrobiota bacterium]